MSQQLTNHNEDLRRLRDSGFDIQIHGGYLFILHVPYVNAKREVKYGVLISSLQLVGTRTTRPNTHVVMFQGEPPCDINGKEILGIKHGRVQTKFPNGVNANLSFSNKPKGGPIDYFEKITVYTRIICAPAYHLDPSVTATAFPVQQTDSSDVVFKYEDTNSSRANINEISSKLSGLKIAIVGLGGTGSYILDSVAKTWVKEIHLFDGKDFQNHNAFRSPGASSIEELQQSLKKVDYYYQKYEVLRNGIYPHPYFVTNNNHNELLNMDFVFIAIDNSDSRYEILNFLIQNNRTFIDVGMGLHVTQNMLLGSLRTTLGYPDHYSHIPKRVPMAEMDINEYGQNIQVVELNALNAIHAIIKWKKHFGCIQDFENECNSVYSVNVGDLLNEDLAA